MEDRPRVRPSSCGGRFVSACHDIEVIVEAVEAIAGKCLKINGGADRDRTGGLQSAILALSQLSYCPVTQKKAYSIEQSA